MFEFIKNTQTSKTGKKPKNKTTTSHQQGLCQIYLLVSPIYLKASVKRAQRRSLFHIKFIVKWRERTGVLAVIFTAVEGLLLTPFHWMDKLKIQVGSRLGNV